MMVEGYSVWGCGHRYVRPSINDKKRNARQMTGTAEKTKTKTRTVARTNFKDKGQGQGCVS